ncbi:MAG: methylenetetrahydrofolate reductase C-terminal domain-containing protein [Chloroflexi bacterium]|nr:methylenetetrahydrofolate reductase C-terminal domain-containing protein [Chloroflexota bacterium]
MYRRIDTRHRTGKLPHIAERAAKIPIFGRLHCVGRSLPDVAYPCPESQSVKIQRNRHCCGTRDGICEIGEKRFLQVMTCGEKEKMLDRPVVFKNGALRGASAWVSYFLDRNRNATRAGQGSVETS